jgi:hypothetical protein
MRIVRTFESGEPECLDGSYGESNMGDKSNSEEDAVEIFHLAG